jgi:deoxyribodipyrimidine photo-lyase
VNAAGKRNPKQCDDGMKNEKMIVWFRNDLRIHDHAPLCFAAEKSVSILPVYIFDERQFGSSPFGFTRAGSHRLRFLRESVMALREKLRSIGSELIIRTGNPEHLLPQLAAEFGATRILYHEEAAFEERGVEKLLQENLLKKHIAWDTWWAATLTPKEDLPFPVMHLPQVFTRFRTQVEKHIVFPEPLPAPNHLNTPEITNCGEWPEGYNSNEFPDNRSAFPFKGGEDEALKRLEHYFWNGDHLRNYEDTRNGLIGTDFSSKFSPWLALGCISPRYIHYETKRYEVKRIRNKSTYWLIFELLWRDFFRFTAIKSGNKLFLLHGITMKDASDHFDQQLFDAWTKGETGFPFIDACMRELKLTGYISNRARQNAASFFVHDLGLDWRAGAAWFESQLIDYDPCSNWGNWAYIAGVGNDPRSNRYFNIPGQSERYDHNGDYIKLWCPELQHIPARYLHHFHEYSSEFLCNLGITINADYSAPVITPAYHNKNKITPQHS